MIWHQADGTVIGREEFDRQLDKLVKGDEWIIDGNYARTLPKRLAHCDTVVFFDLPWRYVWKVLKHDLVKSVLICRWWMMRWIIDFPRDVVPEIEHHLKNFDKTIVRFHSREETDEFIHSLK